MIYGIDGKFLEVINEIKEYDELIYGRFSQFKTINRETDNLLKFSNENIEININDNYKILKNRVVKTDIYVIINNVIAYLLDDKHNTFIHATVVSKDNKGILITGDFGQGKTTLAEEFENGGYEINSSDQTWLKIKENKLYQKLGSRFDINNGRIRMLDEVKTNKVIEIERILKIQGLCDNGEILYKEIDNEYYKVKNLSSFCNWSYAMPLFTDNIELFNILKPVKEFLINMAKTDVIVAEVRGDRKDILRKIKVRN